MNQGTGKQLWASWPSCFIWNIIWEKLLWQKYIPETDSIVPPIYFVLFVCLFFILYVHSTIFQLCGMCLPGLNQY